MISVKLSLPDISAHGRVLRYDSPQSNTGIPLIDSMSNEDIVKKLEQRLGRIYARLRLGIESESGHRIFGGGINFFHPENWYSIHSLIRYCLRVSGLYQRGLVIYLYSLYVYVV